MDRLSLKKKLLVIKLYLEGLSYDEIAAKTSVGKGTVANVITELKAGKFPEYGDLPEQLDLIRELAVDLKRTRITHVQAVLGVTVLSRLQELGIEPNEIEGLSTLCRTLNADGIDIPLFVRAALAFEEERRRTGLSVDELETKVDSLEDTATRLEPLAKEVIKQETQLVELTKQRESLAKEVSVFEKQSNVLQEKVRDREKRETELSNRIRDLEDRVQSADERLNAARKDLRMLSGIGMSSDNLSAFTQRLKAMAQHHGIKPEVLSSRLMDELEQLDEGLKLDTITKAKKEELRMEQRKLLKAKEEQASISSTNENLREEGAILRAALLEEKRYIVTEIKSINTAVKSTITKLKQDLAAGVRDSVLEVNKLKNQSLRLGKELGQYHEMVESNKWLKSLQSLAKGNEEVEPGQVRVIGSTVLHAMITWLDHYSQDNGASWLLRSYIANLIGELEKWIWEMCSELGQQVDIAKRLAVAFADTDTQLVRHDQVSQLEILRSRISSEVENTERMESAAQTGYAEGTLVNSGFALVFGSLFMKAMGRKDSLEIGAQMAGSTLSRKVPFGTVLIGIGKEGIPEDVRVIPVSRLARESKKSETDIEANLKRDGYLLMAPVMFTRALDRVEHEILNESLSLPIKISEITKRITR